MWRFVNSDCNSEDLSEDQDDNDLTSNNNEESKNGNDEEERTLDVQIQRNEGSIENTLINNPNEIDQLMQSPERKKSNERLQEDPN